MVIKAYAFLMVIILMLNAKSTVYGYYHSECGEPPSLKYKKIAKTLGII